MQDPRERAAQPVEPPAPEGDPDDPYDELERIFQEPIVLDDADLPPDPAEEPAGRVERSEAGGGDASTRRLWAHLSALEAEVRRGSERTLEALRRLGERVGSELSMLDKRAINLELTVARLRSIIENLDATIRSPSGGSKPAARSDAARGRAPEDPGGGDEPEPRGEPGTEPMLPGTEPGPSDWSPPDYGPPPEAEPPDDR